MEQHTDGDNQEEELASEDALEDEQVEELEEEEAVAVVDHQVVSLMIQCYCRTKTTHVQYQDHLTELLSLHLETSYRQR